MQVSTIRRATLSLCALLLAVALVGGPALAQEGSPPPGAGVIPKEEVPPGLFQAPGPDSPKTADDVILYMDESKTIGRITIPDPALATLVQPEGRDWRYFRTRVEKWIAAIAITGMAAALLLFFVIRGRIRIERGRAGRGVPRFNGLERFTHWMTATAFLALALTGLIVTFGRPLLIPLIGHPAFTATAETAKYIHNFSSVPFVLGILLMIVLWIRDNIPGKADIAWIRNMGGMFKGGSAHPLSETGRFNAGQKGVFWSVVLGGLALAVTGYLLMVPFYLTGIGGMQILHIVHAILGALMIAGILAHIYIGTVGMEGAFEAMGKGEVDENWAIEHHRGWYEAHKRELPHHSRAPGAAQGHGASAE